MTGADQSDRTGLDQSGRTGFLLLYRSEDHIQVTTLQETAYYLTAWCERKDKHSAATAHHITKQRRLRSCKKYNCTVYGAQWQTTVYTF